LTPNITAFADAIVAFGLNGNLDSQETSFEAMVQACIRTEQVGWRPGSFHIALVVTDAASKEYPWGRTYAGIQMPNNLDDVVDGEPAGSGEDYPSREQVLEVLLDNNINPIILSTAIQYPFWQDVINYWGFGAIANISDSGGPEIIAAVLDGTQIALSKVLLAVTDDIDNVVQSVNPPLYFPAQRNTTVSFNVTLFAQEGLDWYGPETFAELRYAGFGNTVTITVLTNLSCFACDSFNLSSTVDVCGVCGGDGSTCLGCDGVINSGLVNDACGVCGGDNSSCIGCDGQVNGEQLDACGVCGGDNTTCLGCDGKLHSGLELNACGQCGGPPNCKALQGALIGLGVLAGVGVAAAVGVIIFFFVFRAQLAQVDANLLTQLNSIKQNPLYEKSQGEKMNPTYKPKVNDGDN